MALRFGLVGTGHWAQAAHAPALATAEGIEFASVWGRNPQATAVLAEGYGATAHRDVGEFLDSVDGVAFSVPPDVQATIAARAARVGKHLLLEKPVAASLGQADELVRVVQQAGVASVVFFTACFQPDVRAWLARVGGEGPWTGGYALWLATAWHESSPFNTPWRREMGGLWDVAPHAISLLWACLGPVASVTADSGQADVTHLVLHHDSGATSTVTVTLSAPPAAKGSELHLWGEAGRSSLPTQDRDDPVTPLRIALAELVTSATSGRPHPCDAGFGRDVVRVIADAQHQLDAQARR